MLIRTILSTFLLSISFSGIHAEDGGYSTPSISRSHMEIRNSIFSIYVSFFTHSHLNCRLLYYDNSFSCSDTYIRGALENILTRTYELLCDFPGWLYVECTPDIAHASIIQTLTTSGFVENSDRMAPGANYRRFRLSKEAIFEKITQ